MDIPPVIKQANGRPASFVGRNEVFCDVVANVIIRTIGIFYFKEPVYLRSRLTVTECFGNKNIFLLYESGQSQGLNFIPLRQRSSISNQAETSLFLQRIQAFFGIVVQIYVRNVTAINLQEFGYAVTNRIFCRQLFKGILSVLQPVQQLVLRPFYSYCRGNRMKSRLYKVNLFVKRVIQIKDNDLIFRRQ